jgi:hypothetical protein
LTYDCMLTEDTFETINSPVTAGGQSASRLRFADPRVHPLWHAIILIRLAPGGFRSADLRNHLAARSRNDLSSSTCHDLSRHMTSGVALLRDLRRHVPHM